MARLPACFLYDRRVIITPDTARALLFEEIERFRSFDAAEHRHHEAFLDLLRGPIDPFSRSTFTPGHITAAVFILDERNRLLLHHHRRLDRWLQMGGHVEPGESSVEAALREGREESGLDDLLLEDDEIFDLDVHPIPAGKGEPDHLHYDVRYLARTRTPERINADVAESHALRWFTLAEAAGRFDGAGADRVLQKVVRRLR